MRYLLLAFLLTGCTQTTYSKKELEDAFAQRDHAISVLLAVAKQCGCIKDKEAPDPE